MPKIGTRNGEIKDIIKIKLFIGKNRFDLAAAERASDIRY
jgi:hypothetical protein